MAKWRSQTLLFESVMDKKNKQKHRTPKYRRYALRAMLPVIKKLTCFIP